MLVAAIIAGVAILALIVVTGLYLKRTTTYKAIISGDGNRKNKATFANRGFKVSNNGLSLQRSWIKKIGTYYLMIFRVKKGSSSKKGSKKMHFLTRFVHFTRKTIELGKKYFKKKKHCALNLIAHY